MKPLALLRGVAVFLGMAVPGAAAIAGAPVARKPAVPVMVAGKRVRIVCHFPLRTIGETVLPFAEDAVTDTCSILSLDPDRVRPPLVIHLYRTVKAYREVEARLTKGRFATNNAFCSFEQGSAHVALVPECSDAILKRFGPGNVVLRQVAHEAAHLTVYRLVPSYRHHPDWFAEGLATNVADDVMIREGRSPGPAKSPFTSTRMVVAHELLRTGKLPPPSMIFAARPEGLRSSQRYALWWLFFRFLREHEKEQFGKLMARAVSLENGPSYTEHLDRAAMAIWPGPELVRLSRDFRAWVKDRKPEWELVYRSLDIAGDTLVQRAYSGYNSIAWRTSPAGKKQYVIHAEIEIPESPNPQMNLLLGRSPGGFVSVTFRAGYGVTVFDFRVKGDRWNCLGKVAVAALRTGVRLPIDVQVSGEEIRVTVAGREVLTVTAKGRDLSGIRGLGVQRGGVGVWYGRPF